MNDNAKKFFEQAAADAAWCEQMKAAATQEDVLAMCLAKAAELGFDLTAADFAAPCGELSEDELASVAGGAVCFCNIGGGGTADEECQRNELGCLDEVCACVIAGYGSYDDDGSTETRCACAQLGSGASYR